MLENLAQVHSTMRVHSQCPLQPLHKLQQDISAFLWLQLNLETMQIQIRLKGVSIIIQLLSTVIYEISTKR